MNFLGLSLHASFISELFKMTIGFVFVWFKRFTLFYPEFGPKRGTKCDFPGGVNTAARGAAARSREC